MRWVVLLAYIAGVFGMLPFTRKVLITLEQQHLLGAVVTGLYFLAAVVVAYHVIFDARLSDRVAFFTLVALAAIAGGLFMGLKIPEERVHFLQYGVMAWLARAALAARLPPLAQYVAALSLACVLGFMDEWIQGSLKGRVFDSRDVVFNAVGALIALVSYEALHNQLGLRGPRDGRAPE